MDFVDDDAAKACEQLETLRVAQQQRERFGRRQQDVRRAGALPRLAIGRCIAAPHLDPERERHVGDGRKQVALDILRQGFQRRDVERVDTVRHGAAVLL
jgi:hypothetical protein